jgi:hypothetical protein
MLLITIVFIIKGIFKLSTGDAAGFYSKLRRLKSYISHRKRHITILLLKYELPIANSLPLLDLAIKQAEQRFYRVWRHTLIQTYRLISTNTV